MCVVTFTQSHTHPRASTRGENMHNVMDARDQNHRTEIDAGRGRGGGGGRGRKARDEREEWNEAQSPITPGLHQPRLTSGPRTS